MIEQTSAFHVQNDSEGQDIITIWIKEPQEKTSISVDLPEKRIKFTLEELITEKEIRHQTDDYQCIVNYLLYKEIGVIDPAEAGIKDTGTNFTFIAMADPQEGDPDDPGHRNTRMKIHNAFIEESVALVNRLEINPAFTIVIGDVTVEWMEGYRGSLMVLNMLYSANKAWVNIGGNYGYRKYGLPVMVDLKDSPDVWHQASLNIAEDYNNFNEKDGSYASLKPDKLIITMGIWNINDGEEQPFAIYFKDFSLVQNSNSPSTIDGKPVQKKPKELEWWRGRWTNVKNVAGEHRYMLATDPKYKVNPK